MFVLLMLLLFHLTAVLTYTHQKPLENNLWSERCKKHSVVLNDCNWCWCDARQKYQCKARVCEEVDMFGHFKDTIQEMDLGMEGRGSWRSKAKPCSPGIHYQRGSVLCVCDEDGDWPNPVCRDLFRVLHSVELTEKTSSNNESCAPSKLYLTGCNVCFCPSTGTLDPNLCTKKECDEDDPALESNDARDLITDTQKNNKDINNLEVYATCDRNHKYQLGCMNCSCIGNNRLICDNCTSENEQNIIAIDHRPIGRTGYRSYCNGKKNGVIFNIDCNLCHCERRLSLYCTARNCLQPRNVKQKSLFMITQEVKFKNVVAPADDLSCVSTTQYKTGCNICKCVELKSGLKVIDCTLNKCETKNQIESQKEDCVEGTYYKLDCKVCYCYTKDNIKHQVCQILYNDNCVQHLVINERIKSSNTKSVDLQNGYCEPLNVYKKDCNSCRCLSDGKSYMCSSMVCTRRSSDPISVDMVPVHMTEGEDCPVGHSYKLDCNLCFCLANGNAVCTTNNCTKDNDVK